ncbi:MAG: lytic transglycosylase domain-containing protein [Anaerosomatales bacterium]
MRRSRPWAGHRLVLLLVIGALGVLAFFALRGPLWFQRLYYPLAFEAEIAASAERHSVSPFLVAAVINEESGFDPEIVSRAGAVGLMQVMPATAEDMRARGIVDATTVDGVDLADPAANIEYGTAYLRYLVERYHEIEAALAAYNAGLRYADEWAAQGGNIRDEITFSETRHFVVRVVRAKERYEEIYPEAFAGWSGGSE